MGIASSHVIADVVEVSEFPDLANRYAVRGVPKTVINDTVEFLGNVPEAMFMEHIQRAITPSPK
jgi:protein-disulfide isomerase